MISKNLFNLKNNQQNTRAIDKFLNEYRYTKVTREFVLKLRSWTRQLCSREKNAFRDALSVFRRSRPWIRRKMTLITFFKTQNVKDAWDLVFTGKVYLINVFYCKDEDESREKMKMSSQKYFSMKFLLNLAGKLLSS